MSSSKAILVGNGINNLLPGNSWTNLLEELQSNFGAGNRLLSTHNQFPLFYEEILAFARVEGRSDPETRIKEFIAERIKRIQPNNLYSELLKLKCSDYLTTNYDYSIELVADQSFKPKANLGEVDESRYSLFRHFEAGGSRVWHIHGDSARPSTIALGYEQYAGYLQNMRNYMVLGLVYKNREYEPLTKRLRKNERKINSWIDVVLNKDLHIVGLSLDFVEIHLWWLFTFLARRGRESHKKIPYDKKIYYYTPKYYENEAATKLRVMESLGIKVVKLAAQKDKRRQYYLDVIEKIDAA